MKYDTGWLKSSRSAGNSKACVEVRRTDRTVAVRDSKAPSGGQLEVSQSAWRAFLRAVR